MTKKNSFVFFWGVIIFILSATPSLLFIVPLFFADKSDITISIVVPTDFDLNECSKTRGFDSCLAFHTSLLEIKKELNNFSSDMSNQIEKRLEDQDRISGSLTLLISLYAILITVIAIFFSLRESSRIDDGLEAFTKEKIKIDKELNELKKNNDQAVQLIERLKEKVEEHEVKLQDSNSVVNAADFELKNQSSNISFPTNRTGKDNNVMNHVQDDSNNMTDSFIDKNKQA